MKHLLHIFVLAAAIAAGMCAYPAQRWLAAEPIGESVTHAQVAHVAVLVTAATFSWPGSSWGAVPRAFAGFAATISIIAWLMVPYADGRLGPPLMFFIAALLALLVAREVGRS